MWSFEVFGVGGKSVLWIVDWFCGGEYGFVVEIGDMLFVFLGEFICSVEFGVGEFIGGGVVMMLDVNVGLLMVVMGFVKGWYVGGVSLGLIDGWGGGVVSVVKCFCFWWFWEDL